MLLPSDAISFTAVFVWCGFQTGNTVQVRTTFQSPPPPLTPSDNTHTTCSCSQLALALARLFSPGNTDFSFHMADRQALVSLITFLGGASLGRIGDKIGNNKRVWLILGTIIQSLFTMGAALTIWQSGESAVADNRGDPSRTNALSFVALGFASASIGLQGIMGKRVNSQFATTGEDYLRL